MYYMAKAKSGLDRRQPCSVPDDDHIASPVVVRSLGSNLCSHHTRLASSGHSRTVSEMKRLRLTELKALAKSRRRIASPFVLASAAIARMEWIPISYPPLRTPSCIPEITCEMRALTFEQYAFVRSRLRAQPMLMGRTSFRCSSLYKAISLDSAVSSPNDRQ